MVHVININTNKGVYINPKCIILINATIPYEQYEVTLIDNNKVIINYNDFERIRKALL